MSDTAVVISCGEKIVVCQMEKSECISCSAECGKNRRTFEVTNPQNFSLKEGEAVLISATKAAQAAEGLLSLLVPFLCSFAGYFFADPIMRFFGKTISSDGKAVFVLGFLFASMLAVFFVTRKLPVRGRPEIVEIL